MTNETTGVAPKEPFDDPVTSNKMAIRALIPLLITFVLGTLCLQGFNLVFQQVGADVGAPNQASLITAFPSIVLGIVCFIYGSLGDFVSLRKLVTVGLVTLFIGSLFGFVTNYFFTANLWTVIIARVLQTAGEQVAGSAFLVVATKYLRNDLKVIFFGCSPPPTSCPHPSACSPPACSAPSHGSTCSSSPPSPSSSCRSCSRPCRPRAATARRSTRSAL